MCVAAYPSPSTRHQHCSSTPPPFQSLLTALLFVCQSCHPPCQVLHEVAHLGASILCCLSASLWHLPFWFPFQTKVCMSQPVRVGSKPWNIKISPCPAPPLLSYIPGRTLMLEGPGWVLYTALLSTFSLSLFSIPDPPHQACTWQSSLYLSCMEAIDCPRKLVLTGTGLTPLASGP